MIFVCGQTWLIEYTAVGSIELNENSLSLSLFIYFIIKLYVRYNNQYGANNKSKASA